VRGFALALRKPTSAVQNSENVKIGDKIRVEAYKANGICYRYWDTTIVELSDGLLVTASPAGQMIVDVNRGAWVGSHILRTYYGLDKLYNLIEIFATNGHLLEIYINIASRPWFKAGFYAISTTNWMFRPIRLRQQLSRMKTNLPKLR
jgi:hypothetical protein